LLRLGKVLNRLLGGCPLSEARRELAGNRILRNLKFVKRKPGRMDSKGIDLRAETCMQFTAFTETSLSSLTLALGFAVKAVSSPSHPKETKG